MLFHSGRQNTNSSRKVAKLLDVLATRCEEYLKGFLGLNLDQHSANYNKMQVCRGIYQFMIAEGFSLAPSEYCLTNLAQLLAYSRALQECTFVP